MKVAVSTDDGKTICGHLGRCASFVVFEIGEGKITSEVRSNSFTHHATGDCAGHHEPGHGNHSHSSVIEALRDCQVVISRGMGWRIMKELENAEIKPIITSETDAERAVQDYLDGKLEHSPENACGCGGVD